MSEHWTLADEHGMGLYLVDSEDEAREWCHADYGGDNVIRPLRVFMARLSRQWRYGWGKAPAGR